MQLAPIQVGTASWTDPSLIKSGRFYPKGVTSPESRLRFYASRFPMVEVDSSYYAMPSAKNAELWVERTPDDFTFNIKAFRLLTGHQTPKKALPKDIAEALAPHFAEKKNVYYKDVPGEIRDEVWRRFELAIRPLGLAGKLKAVHFQFAPWVTPSPDWKRHIEECAGRLADYLLAIEFRNRAWYDGKRDAETLAFERDLGAAHVVVDEPQVSAQSIPQVWAVADPRLVILRLHGRNDAMWDAKGLTAASNRFDYDYSDDELGELADKLLALRSQAELFQVINNNNNEDQNVRNAATMMRLLDERSPGAVQSP